MASDNWREREGGREGEGEGEQIDNYNTVEPLNQDILK